MHNILLLMQVVFMHEMIRDIALYHHNIKNIFPVNFLSYLLMIH